MIPPAPIVALLLSLPQCWREPRDVERLTLIAESIAAVSASSDDAAALLTIGTVESAWCAAVHSGAKRGGRGQGLWQIEPGSNRTGPFYGLDRASTEHAATEALWLWRHSRQCGNDLASRFEAYAGIGCVAWLGAGKRARLYRWISWVLTR